LENLQSYLKSEDWLRDLFDHAHDLIQVVNLDGTLMYVNKSWSLQLDYAPDEIIGRPLYDFIDEEDLERYFNYRKDVISGKISGQPIIFNLVAKNGKKVTVEGVVSVKVLNGDPIYTRGIFRNISDRLENEYRLRILNQKLNEREFNLQQLVTYAPDAIVVINEEGLITYWNPKAEQVFGWTAEEVRGRSLADTIIPVQHREAHETGIRRYLTTGEQRVLNKTIEITALNKEGAEFYVSLTISRAVQQQGAAFIGFIRDISEQKINEFEIRKKTMQLEESNKRLEAFAYAASHDLKQPIRKVQIFLDRLYNSVSNKIDAGEKEYFHKIEHAAKRMKELVNDLLSYSSLSTDAEFAKEVNLNNVVKEVLADLEVEVVERNAHIKVDTLPTVKGNKRQLHQLFHNLIGNAVKYGKSSANNLVHITSKHISEPSAFNLNSSPLNQSYHLIQISDNGIGFRQDQAEKIFDIFTRLHTHNNYPGSGVGLSIARKVVENHSGFIKADGVPGEGATFSILLPA
jgi:PAS domain S-box-containing protein